MDKNNGIKDAKEKLESVSGDYEIRRIAELKEKAIRDEISIKEYAMETGLKEGREEGRKEGIEMVAKNMLSFGMDIDSIIKVTGLPREQILKLKQ